MDILYPNSVYDSILFTRRISVIDCGHGFAGHDKVRPVILSIDDVMPAEAITFIQQAIPDCQTLEFIDFDLENDVCVLGVTIKNYCAPRGAVPSQSSGPYYVFTSAPYIG